MASKRKPVLPRQSAAASSDADRLAKAADILFGTEENPLVLRDGRKVTVQRGKVAHLGLLLAFFDALVQRVNKDDIITLVQLIEERTGKQNGEKEPLSVDSLVRQVFDRSSLLLQVLHSTVEVLPRLAEAMTTLSAIDFNELDADEGMLVAFAIFEVNWDFFSQNLPQAMRGSLPRLASKLTAS